MKTEKLIITVQCKICFQQVDTVGEGKLVHHGKYDHHWKPKTINRFVKYITKISNTIKPILLEPKESLK